MTTASFNPRHGRASSVPQVASPQVVVVEDRLEDELLIREALAPRFPNAQITVLRDGEQMMRWIDMIESEYAPCPDVILLDLNLPRFRGEQVLERLRGTARCGPIPVVIVTSSDAPADRLVAARLEAARYFRKPQDYDAFMKLGDVVHDVLGSTGAAGAARK
jgi:CheY-like chemotaxis protein